MKSTVISIGKEIISGITLDTNSFFIASYLSRLGFYNRFLLSVDDIEQDIIDTIHYALSKADIIITTGGLGPTFDDITLEAVAKALNRKIYLDKDALEFIENFYTKLFKEGKIDSPGINEKRKKMAYLIDGCKPLKNSVGAAWGVYVEDEGKHIFCLPGVPKEMKPMFENEVVPVLEKLSDKVLITKEFTVDTNDESILGEYIDKVMKNLDVYIKSLPEGFEGKKMKVRFTSYGKNKEEALEKINKAYKSLVEFINSKIS